MDPHRLCREHLKATPDAVAGQWLRGDAARGWYALQALWHEFRAIPRQCSEAAVARLKLAWWQDQLGQRHPVHPLARALADTPVTPSALAPLLAALDVRLTGETPGGYFQDTDGLLCAIWQAHYRAPAAYPAGSAELGALIGQARALLELGADLRGVAAVPGPASGSAALAQAAGLATALRDASGAFPGAGPGLLAVLLAATLEEISSAGLDPARVHTRLPAWRMHGSALTRAVLPGFSSGKPPPAN